MTAPLVATRFDDRGDAGRIAWVTFNDPERRNALGLAGKAQLIDTLTGLRHDASLRALVPEERESMNRSLRAGMIVVLFGLSVGGAGVAGAALDGSEEAAVGRIVFIEVHHGFVTVDFPNGRMNVAMDKREMGQYIPGDEIRIDSFGRPLPKLGGGLRPPSDGRRAP